MLCYVIADKKPLMLPVRAIQRLKSIVVISDCFGNKVNLHNGLTNYSSLCTFSDYASSFHMSK